MSELDEAGVEAAAKALFDSQFKTLFWRKVPDDMAEVVRDAARSVIDAYQQATEAALTQALAERDGLREALERIAYGPKGGLRLEQGTPLPTVEAEIADAALATAPNTKDGEAIPSPVGRNQS